MPEITSEQVADAIAELLAARASAIAGLSLHDPDDPRHPYEVGPQPGPARPEDITQTEDALGVKLPPSYRYFLSLHNGLKDFDLGSVLLGTGDLVALNAGDAADLLSPILPEIERSTTDGLIVIGTTKGDASMFIFDSNKLDEYGEWTVIEYDAEDGMLDEYDNFVAFLEDTADTLRMMSGGRR